MTAPNEIQLDSYLDRVVNHIQQLRQIDFSDEAAVAQAMNQSQQVMGALAMYRHQLRNVEERVMPALRYAA